MCHSVIQPLGKLDSLNMLVQMAASRIAILAWHQVGRDTIMALPQISASLFFVMKYLKRVNQV